MKKVVLSAILLSLIVFTTVLAESAETEPYESGSSHFMRVTLRDDAGGRRVFSLPVDDSAGEAFISVYSAGSGGTFIELITRGEITRSDFYLISWDVLRLADAKGIQAEEDRYGRREIAYLGGEMASIGDLDGAGVLKELNRYFEDEGIVFEYARIAIAGEEKFAAFTVNDEGLKRLDARYVMSDVGTGTGDDTVNEKTSDGVRLAVTGTTVNIRSGPGTETERIGTLNKGDRPLWTGKTEKDERGVEWYEIDLDGSPGWVSGKYVKTIG